MFNHTRRHLDNCFTGKVNVNLVFPENNIAKYSAAQVAFQPSIRTAQHSAAPDTTMSHLVITDSKDGENVIAKEKVTDEQYEAASQ